jgi:hypothetical protein
MTNIEQTIVYDGKAAREKAVKDSERSDMKQHADKLYQGYKKLKESDTKRAIWEMFQNAIDLAEECEIVIEEKENAIEFTHNGELFSHNTLISLIKQVSSKSVKSNEKEVGQYGTGFLTTHSFGRRIILNSFMDEDGRKIRLENFEIDRICELDKPEQLIDKLIDQRDLVFELVEKGVHDEYWQHITTFSYEHESDLQKRNAVRALDKMEALLPYVMLFNKKLLKVTIKRLTIEPIVYEKAKLPSQAHSVETAYETATINKNGSPTNYLYLQTFTQAKPEDPLITVVLPLTADLKAYELDKDISRLFLFFPLIGTEAFGFNCIVHSRTFKCTEPRDGIYLSSDSEANKSDESINQELIKKASELVFEFLRQHDLRLSNPLYLAKFNFNRTTKEIDNENEQLLASYFINLQQNWVNEIRTFRLVETQHEQIAPENACFLSPELLNPEYVDAYPAIYKLASKYWDTLPKESIAIEWTEIVSNWGDDRVQYITASLLLQKIAAEGNLSNLLDYEDDLKTFYQYLIKLEKVEFFKQYKLLPNIDNDFIDLVTAKLPEDIHDELIPIAKVLIPTITNKFIREDFVLGLKIETYDRKVLDSDIKVRNSEINNRLSKGFILDNDDLFALMQYCSIFPQIDKRGKRGEIIDLLGKFHEYTIKYKEIPNVIDKELDFVPATRNLLKDIILRLGQVEGDGLKLHLQLLHDLLEITYNSSDYKETVLALPVYPNQLLKLSLVTQLSKDEGIPIEIKELYDKVVLGGKKSIKSDLLLSKFNDVIETTNFKSPKYLANEIYTKFSEAGKVEEINNHKYEPEIMDIIKRMTGDKDWANFFPEIYSERSVILMKKVTEGVVKDDLFRIIGSGAKTISILGKLAGRTDLEYLIKLGDQAIETEKKSKADFEYKKTIGVNIEKLIREKISSDVELKVLIENEDKGVMKVDELQGGQDIVISLNGNPVYYIEVKSRWDSNNSVFMSKLQLERASKESERYALCSVDMTKTDLQGEEKYKVKEIEKIVEHVRFVDDIGTLINPLVENNLLAETTGDNVRLVDYRGLVPQDIINGGKQLATFIQTLCDIINKRLLNGISQN